MTEANSKTTTPTSEDRLCDTCKFVAEALDGPHCAGCFGSDFKANWQPREEEQLELPLEGPQGPTDCGGLKCGVKECASCFPPQVLSLTGWNPSHVITDELVGKPLPENPKAIYGRAKPSVALVPSGALLEMADVFALGATKYGPFNWRKDPVEAMTYANAALRHLFSWVDGEDIDPESGRSHLAHFACCAAIVLDAMHNGTLIDNRPFAGPAARLIRERTKAVA